VASLSDPVRKDQGEWTDAIGSALTRRLDCEKQGIECAFARDARKPESAREWLFDFSAVLVEPNDRSRERYLMQALVIGEVEWHHYLDKDFEKLLVASAADDQIVVIDGRYPPHKESTLAIQTERRPISSMVSSRIRRR
jgi:hypothetical protein